MNLILSHIEIRQLYMAFLHGKVSLNDINESHQAQLLIYANEEHQRAINTCCELMASNPNNDFEYFSSRLSTYKESKQVIDFFENWHKKKQADKPESSTTKSKSKNKTTYQWQGKSDELPELYRLMRDEYKLIAHEVDLKQFTAIFTGQSIDNIKPIKWISSNKLLAYLLEIAFSNQNWQSIAGNNEYFINKNDKIINANDLSVAKNQIESYGNPKGYEKIDLILKTIKKH